MGKVASTLILHFFLLIFSSEFTTCTPANDPISAQNTVTPIESKGLISPAPFHPNSLSEAFHHFLAQGSSTGDNLRATMKFTNETIYTSRNDINHREIHEGAKELKDAVIVMYISAGLVLCLLTMYMIRGTIKVWKKQEEISDLIVYFTSGSQGGLCQVNPTGSSSTRTIPSSSSSSNSNNLTVNVIPQLSDLPRTGIEARTVLTAEGPRRILEEYEECPPPSYLESLAHHSLSSRNSTKVAQANLTKK